MRAALKILLSALLLAAALVAAKRSFDPASIMNPGVLVDPSR